MKNKTLFKNIIELFAVLLIILSAAACSSEGDINTGEDISTYTYSKFKYSLEDNGIEILGYNGGEHSLILPQIIDGKEVVSIKSLSSKTLVSITLPPSLKRIESKAFENCLSLESVNITGEDITIAEDAFANLTDKQTTEPTAEIAKTSLSAGDITSVDTSNCTITFSVSSEKTINENAILNHSNTIVLNSVQKSILQKFIDTGYLQKYRIVRKSADSDSILEVDNSYIYYDKKVNGNSVYSEVLIDGVSYIDKNVQKLKRQSLPDIVFENARIKLSELSISPNFKTLQLDEINGGVIYHSVNQTIEFNFGENYIQTAVERYVKDGISITNEYSIEADCDILKKTIDGNEYTLAENKTVEIMFDETDSGINFQGQKKFTVSYDSLLFKPNLWKNSHRIVGYYTDSIFTTKWNFETDTVTSDLKLYIKFEQCRQTVDDYDCWIDDQFAYIFSYLGDELDELHIPSTLKGLPVKQLNWINAHTKNIFLPNVYFEFKDPYDAYKNFYIDPANIYFSAKDGVIFDKNETTLLHVNSYVEHAYIPASVQKFSEFYKEWIDRVYFFESKELPKNAGHLLTVSEDETNLHCVTDYLNNTEEIKIFDGVTYKLYADGNVTAILLGSQTVVTFKDYVAFNGVQHPVTKFRTKDNQSGEKLIIKLPGTIDLEQNDFWKDKGYSYSHYSNTVHTIYYIDKVKPEQTGSERNPYVVWNSSSNETDENGNRYVVENNILYSISNGTAKAIMGSADLGNLVIPEKVDNVPVTEIAEKCFYLSKVTSITVPDSLYAMGYKCLPDKFIASFSDGYIYFNKVLYCYKGILPQTLTVAEGTKGISRNLRDERYMQMQITSLTLPDSLLYIGDRTFYGLLDIDSLELPGNIIYIGDYAFASLVSTDSIKYVIINGNPDYIGQGAFAGNMSIYKIHFPDTDTNDTLEWHSKWRQKSNNPDDWISANHRVCYDCHCDSFGSDEENETTILPFTFKYYNIDGQKLTFEYQINGEHTLDEIISVKLYENEVFKKEIDSTITEIDGLLFNHNYKLVALYYIGDVVKEIYLQFSIPAKQIPTCSLDSFFSDSSTIYYQIILKDINKIGHIEKISLTNELTQEIIFADLTKFSEDNTYNETFENLLSNTNYILEVIYSYDALDASGEQKIIHSKYISTLANIKPYADLSSYNVSYTSFGFLINFYDYGYSSITEISIYSKYYSINSYANVLEKSLTDFSVREFENLKTNTFYYLVVIFKYDLNDGLGEQYASNHIMICTESYDDPVVSIYDITPSYENVSCKIDINEQIDMTTIKNVIIGENSYSYSPTMDIAGLLSNNNYNITVEYEVDKNDSLGIQTYNKTAAFKTLKYSRDQYPMLTINHVEVTKDSFTIDDYSWTNPYNLRCEITGFIYTLLYYDGYGYVPVYGNTATLSASNLYSNSEYAIALNYEFDFNDGKTKGTGTAVGISSITTLAKVTPTAHFEFDEGDITHSSIKVRLVINDPDNIARQNNIFATLYDGSNQIAIREYTNEIFFDNLLSNHQYNITTYVYYNLNEAARRDNIEIYEVSRIGNKNRFTTKSYDVPAFEFKEFFADEENIEIDYEKTDTYSLISSYSLYYSCFGVSEKELENNQKLITGLYSNMEYTIRLVYTYDLKDGNGNRTNTITKKITTVAKTVPTCTIEVTGVNYRSFDFEYDLVDPSGTATLVSLYCTTNKDYNFFRDLINCNGKATDIYSNSDYTLYLCYMYDLNDRSEPQYIYASTTCKTLKYEVLPNIDFLGVTGTPGYDTFSVTGKINNLDSELFEYVDLVISGAFPDTTERRKTIRIEEFDEDGVFNYTFLNLFSNNNYSVTCYLYYDVYESSNKTSYTKNTSAKTAEYELTIDYTLTSYNTSAKFEIQYYDPTYSGRIYKYILLDEITKQKIEIEPCEMIKDLFAGCGYTLTVVYLCDKNDGKGEREFFSNIDFRTKSYYPPKINLYEQNLNYEYMFIEFKYKIFDYYGNLIDNDLFNEYCAIDNISLFIFEERYFQGEVKADYYFVDSITDLTINKFENLLADKRYKIVFHYHADMHNGTAMNFYTSEKEVYIWPIPRPEITEFECTPTYNTIKINYNLISTEHNNVKITKIECLYGADEPIELNYPLNTFLRVKSNTTYEIRIYYSFDLKEGLGTRTEYETFECTTPAHTVPVFEFNDVTSTKNSIAFDYTKIDSTSCSGKLTMQLLLNGNLVQTLYYSEKEFTELYSNTNYTIRATLSYDLNQGDGAQNLITEYDIKTQSYAIPKADYRFVYSNGGHVIIEFIMEQEVPFMSSVISCKAIEEGSTELINFTLTNIASEGKVYETASLKECSYYQIQYTIHYNMLDGFGERTMVQYFNYVTTPNFFTCNLSGYGDTYNDNFEINLFLDVKGSTMDRNYTFVEINGAKYSLTYYSFEITGKITYLINSDIAYEAGKETYDFVLTKIYYMLDGEEMFAEKNIAISIIINHY